MTGVKPGDPFQPEAPADPFKRQMHELERGLTVRIEEQARENRRLRRLWMGTVVTGALLLGLATALVIVSAPTWSRLGSSCCVTPMEPYEVPGVPPKMVRSD
jgi:hypothetical protein